MPSVSIDVNVLNSYHRALASGPKGLPALGLRADRTRGDPNLHGEALLERENGGHVASVIRARGPEGPRYPVASSESRAFPSMWSLHGVARICASWGCYGSPTRRAMMRLR